MIERDEIKTKAGEFSIHPSHVERDYVFGWLLVGIYTISKLKDILALKGGNCFRKGYFPHTRFSKDLDFSTPTAVDEVLLKEELDKVCRFVQETAGVIFELERNRVEEKRVIDGERKVFEARLYFKDFFGEPSTATISVRLDVAQFDKIYLPIQARNLIHPYSDSSACRAEIRCVKLEELLASKLKCLLQRKHSFDLFDFVYSVFIARDVEVNRREIVTTFLKKTIFERSPGFVKELLLGLPFELFRGFWGKYVLPVCPKVSLIEFDDALGRFKLGVLELFGSFVMGREAQAFFPPAMRGVLLDAGSGMRILRMTYDGVERQVEPYSLRYKRRNDGTAQEYFYGYDRTGGRSSGPGIKSFVHSKIGGLLITEEKFEPRFPVEIAKAGEPSERSTFASRKKWGFVGIRTRFRSSHQYIVECSSCGKHFRRATYTTKLKEHQDKYRNACYGRVGTLIDRL